MPSTIILVIDDHENTLHLMHHQLERLDGFKVLTAHDGATGVKMAQQHNPHLILLDWIMPGMDGMEVLNKLKASPSTSHIPIYMLTTQTKMADVEHALHAGADGYFTKPVKPSDISKKIKRVLEKG